MSRTFLIICVRIGAEGNDSPMEIVSEGVVQSANGSASPEMPGKVTHLFCRIPLKLSVRAFVEIVRCGLRKEAHDIHSL